MGRPAPLRSIPNADHALDCPDGGVVRRVGDAIEFRDRDDRLLIRYERGALVVAPAAGDLRLVSTAGRVQIEGAVDVEVLAGRDICLKAARSVDARLETRSEQPHTPIVRVDAKGVRVSGHEVTLEAHHVRTVANIVEHTAATLRTSATVLETRAREIRILTELLRTEAHEITQEVIGVLETRARRIRSVVKETFTLTSKSTTLLSEEDTAIDGKRVLLG